MRIISMVLTLFMLAGGVLYASPATAADTLPDAERLLDSQRYSDAEKMLERIIAREPRNARAHQLLGDAYKRQSRFEEALSEYDRAIELGGENAEIYKSKGTVNKWMGNTSAAAANYRKALRINPGDAEATADLRELKRSKGIDVSFFYGGWGPDYTTDAYEVMLKYSGFDNLDLYAGGGFADQVYYDRTKYYAKAYYFYAPGNYLKVNPQYKDYDYPTSKVATPDSNSYDKVPSVEFEVQHWITRELRGNLIYEFSRPSFFHDQDSHATNHKVTGELYWLSPYENFRFKGFLALLRDPDPDTTLIKNRTCLTYNPGPPVTCATFATETSVDYQIQALLGGAVEYSSGPWEAEVKYIPNRDLDSSYDYSILAGVGYDFTDRLTGRVDTVYDKYSAESNFSGSTANVYLLSGFYEVTPALDMGAGYKYLDLPDRKESTGFLTLTYKTGLGF